MIKSRGNVVTSCIISAILITLSANILFAKDSKVTPPIVNKSGQSKTEQINNQCQNIFGGKIASLESNSIFLERCAVANIEMNEFFDGDYIGLLFNVNLLAWNKFKLDQNTFIEYNDGSVGRIWVAWFPKLFFMDKVNTINGTAISVKIQMMGLENGDARGALVYGSMLFHRGPVVLRGNMAYTNQKNSEGLLEFDPSAQIELDYVGSKSAGFLLLLFPKHDSSIKKLSVAGSPLCQPSCRFNYAHLYIIRPAITPSVAAT